MKIGQDQKSGGEKYLVRLLSGEGIHHCIDRLKFLLGNMRSVF
jgi:hypothetical protein